MFTSASESSCILLHIGLLVGIGFSLLKLLSLSLLYSSKRIQLKIRAGMKFISFPVVDAARGNMHREIS